MFMKFTIVPELDQGLAVVELGKMETENLSDGLYLQEPNLVQSYC